MKLDVAEKKSVISQMEGGDSAVNGPHLASLLL